MYSPVMRSRRFSMSSSLGMPLKRPKFLRPLPSVSSLNRRINASGFHDWHCFYPLEYRSISCDDLLTTDAVYSGITDCPTTSPKHATSHHAIYAKPSRPPPPPFLPLPISPPSTVACHYGSLDLFRNTAFPCLETDRIVTDPYSHPRAIWNPNQPLSAYGPPTPQNHHYATVQPAENPYQIPRSLSPPERIYRKKSPTSACSSSSSYSTCSSDRSGWVGHCDYRSLESLHGKIKAPSKRYFSAGNGLDRSIDSSDRLCLGLGKRFRKAKSELCLSADGTRKKAILVLTAKDIQRIELMHSGLTTKRLYVCECLANLYFDDAQSTTKRPAWSSAPFDESPAIWNNKSRWRRIATGVPLLILQSKNQSPYDHAPQHYRLFLRLAEFETGFTVWEEEIDSELEYKAATDGLRTFHKFANFFQYQNRKAGLSFDSQMAAMKFYERVVELCEELAHPTGDGRLRPTTKPINHHEAPISRAYRGPLATNLTSLMRRVRFKSEAPNSNDYDLEMPSLKSTTPNLDHGENSQQKSKISLPCFFQHVTCLRQRDAVTAMRSVPAGCAFRGGKVGVGLR